MKEQERDQLKDRILEIEPCIKFESEHEEKLIGYAERFGCHIIPMYEGINTFFTKNYKEAEDKAQKLTSIPVGTFPGLEDSVVGYITLENGAVAMLHDKESYLQKLAKEYEESDKEEGVDEDPDYSYYVQALEWYEYNVLGLGLSDRTTPAFACTDEFPLPVTLDG